MGVTINIVFRVSGNSLLINIYKATRSIMLQCTYVHPLAS